MLRLPCLPALPIRCPFSRDTPTIYYPTRLHVPPHVCSFYVYVALTYTFPVYTVDLVRLPVVTPLRLLLHCCCTTVTDLRSLLIGWLSRCYWFSTLLRFTTDFHTRCRYCSVVPCDSVQFGGGERRFTYRYPPFTHDFPFDGCSILICYIYVDHVDSLVHIPVTLCRLHVEFYTFSGHTFVTR